MPILHTSTALFSKPAHLSHYLFLLPKSYRSHILFFALSGPASSSQSDSELSSLVSALTSFSPHHVGCLSAPLIPQPSSHTSSATQISCSLAVFDKSTSTVFRSTLPGRAQSQVGRWHSFRKKGDATLPPGTYSVGLREDVNWEDVWKRDIGGNELPEELKSLSPESVMGVAYLSDGAPEGLSNALNALPNAAKLGLLASSTPFITGRPVTLFHNGEIYSDGAVGVATIKASTVSSVEFHGLRGITPLHKITRSDGNLVQELDESNPTALLLNAIRASGAEDETRLAQDEEYFLGVLRNDELWQVYRIMSGDPSRGTMSLESEVAPPVGASVKLYHLPKSKVVSDGTSKPTLAPRTISFVSTPAPDDTDAAATAEGSWENTFVAASENGWMLSRPGEEAWRCTVARGRAGLRWRQ